MRALVIGCGYLGRRVAVMWRTRGNQVDALTRSPENAAAFTDLGVTPIVGDVLQPATLQRLPAADVVLYAVGYDKRAGVSKRDVYVKGVENVLHEIAPRVQRFLHVSSTSVYGQDAGEWVDENSECSPSSEDGETCLAAEEAVWRTFGPPNIETRNPVAMVLRFSGIYGPGRLLRRMESVRSGEPIRANPDGFLNLIHVDDGAEIVTALAAKGRPGSTYLVTDDKPIQRREYYGLLASQIGAPAPVFQFHPTEAGGLNKRCSNVKIRGELGDIFQFPTIQTGLLQAVQNAD